MNPTGLARCKTAHDSELLSPKESSGVALTSQPARKKRVATAEQVGHATPESEMAASSVS